MNLRREIFIKNKSYTRKTCTDGLAYMLLTRDIPNSIFACLLDSQSLMLPTKRISLLTFMENISRRCGENCGNRCCDSEGLEKSAKRNSFVFDAFHQAIIQQYFLVAANV